MSRRTLSRCIRSVLSSCKSTLRCASDVCSFASVSNTSACSARRASSACACVLLETTCLPRQAGRVLPNCHDVTAPRVSPTRPEALREASTYRQKHEAHLALFHFRLGTRRMGAQSFVSTDTSTAYKIDQILRHCRIQLVLLIDDCKYVLSHPHRAVFVMTLRSLLRNGPMATDIHAVFVLLIQHRNRAQRV